MKKGKLLLTSGGITNESIQKALVDLLGKPLRESSALFVPTAIYAFPHSANWAWDWIKRLGELEWKEFGVLELTALSSLPREFWLPQLEETDALIMGGGNEFYLSYWMEISGLFDVLPHLMEQGQVYVGVSAGTMVVTPDEGMPSSAGSTKTLPLVDFVVRPHFMSDYFPQTTPENLEKWAAKVAFPLYALDDESAVKVVDGQVEVVSNGTWRLFAKP